MDLRLIALDMDGTLLDAAGDIPPGFDKLLVAAQQRGVVLAPASGRPLPTLQGMFGDRPAAPEAYIAENGAVVWHNGEVISTTPIGSEPVAALLAASAGHPFIPVVCTPTVAYVPVGLTEAELAAVSPYYHRRIELADMQEAVSEDVVKIAFYHAEDAESVVYPVVADASPGLNVVMSGRNWVDVMAASASKGIALNALAEALGLARAHTAAFGDYLNDYELLRAAGTSWAMENAHPELKAIADYIAPPNTEHGVITVLREVLAS